MTRRNPRTDPAWGDHLVSHGYPRHVYRVDPDGVHYVGGNGRETRETLDEWREWAAGARVVRRPKPQLGTIAARDADDCTGGPVIAAPPVPVPAMLPAVVPKCDALAAAKLVFGPKAERIDPKGDLRLLPLLCDLAAQPAAERKCQASAVDAVFSCAVECVTIATIADGGPACTCHGSAAGDYGCNVKS